MSPEERLMLKAAAFAVGRSARLKPVVGYTWDDARADAMFGAWQVAKLEHSDENHLVNLMAGSGYRRILDGRTAQYRANRFTGAAGHDRIDDEDEIDQWPEQIDWRQPFSDLFSARLAAHVDRLPEPLPTIANMLFEGAQHLEIAKELGVSISRVTQRVDQLRHALRHHNPAYAYSSTA